MDARERSIVAQTCLKVSGEIYASLCDVSQGFQPDLLEAVFKKVWQLHSATVGAQPAPAPPVQDPGAPFGPPAQPVPVNAPVQQPVPQSQPVAQPSQPQPVMAGPPCPNCQTPMSMTNDYAAKKARNLAAGKKAPPMWKCPMGSYSPQTGAQGCQGAGWETAA